LKRLWPTKAGLSKLDCGKSCGTQKTQKQIFVQNAWLPCMF
jgi:hypothetical protein